MDLNDLKMQARMLMTAHGVGSLEFGFSNTKRAIAQCHGITMGRYPNATSLATKITFSRHWGQVLDAEDCRNVMLHEIAHALTIGHDHDAVFMAKCRELGTPANRTCYRPKADIEYKWTSKCPAGHEGSRLHRAPTTVKSCAKCSNRFDFSNVFTWYRDGRKVELNDMPAKYQTLYRSLDRRARMAEMSFEILPGMTINL